MRHFPGKLFYIEIVFVEKNKGAAAVVVLTSDCSEDGQATSSLCGCRSSFRHSLGDASLHAIGRRAVNMAPGGVA